MSAKIFHFHQFKKIEFKYLEPTKEKFVFNVFFTINSFPFIIKKLQIQSVEKDQVTYIYESIEHDSGNDDKIKVCPFCNDNFKHTSCQILSNDKENLLNKEFRHTIFFPIISYYYHQNERNYFEKLIDINIYNFEVLFMGLSENTYIQCIFKYQNQLFLYQDVFQEDKSNTLPLIFYLKEDKNEIGLYLEYLLPEILVPITSLISEKVNESNNKIYDTTGITIKDLLSNIKDISPN